MAHPGEGFALRVHDSKAGPTAAQAEAFERLLANARQAPHPFGMTMLLPFDRLRPLLAPWGRLQPQPAPGERPGMRR